MREEKKVVVSTGGAMGQGRAHGVKFAENGFDVVLANMLDPEDERYRETVRMLNELGAEVLAVKANICSTPDMEKLFTRILHDVKDGYELSDESVDKIKLWVDRLDTGTEARTLLYKALEGNSLSEREKGYLLYCLVKGKTLVTQAEKKSDLHLARAIVEQAAMDTLQVSAGIAEEIRKMVFWYAASQVEQDEIRHRNLMYYGGVK